MENTDICNAIEKNRIIAILRNVPLDQIRFVVKALYNGGIRLVEVAYNSENKSSIKYSSKLIESINTANLEGLFVGAGTVISNDLVIEAKDAGATFILSPVMNKEVIQTAKKEGLVVIPGCFTPTEIYEAKTLGADFIKLFPANCLDPNYIKGLRGPLENIPIISVGGINEKNLTSYLEAGSLGVGIGSHLISKNDLKNHAYEQITLKARKYINLINSINERIKNELLCNNY